MSRQPAFLRSKLNLEAKRLLLLVALSQPIATGAQAATATRGSVDHKLSIQETSGNGKTTTTTKFTLKTTFEATLEESEVAQFGPDTRFQGSFPLGPSLAVRLSDDPKYDAGDASARITRTTVFNGLSWKQTIQLKWAQGKLKVTATVTTNRKRSSDALVQWEDVPKTTGQRTAASPVLLSILGDVSGVEFLTVQLLVPATFKTSTSIETKRNGSTNLTSKQSIKGRL